MTKRAKRKTKIKNKFVILRLRLFENHAAVAKIISLFVEKTDFFLWNVYFLVERRCSVAQKGFCKKKRFSGELHNIFFMENLCGKGFLDVKD